ncbi:MAG: PHP domain-containing protein [Coriobacteriia bacterium]|nr:PHP domain-containing protein [Coriobacteriia bacterium]
MKADLHVHTTASDGTLSPSQLVQRASHNGVDVLAIADHDSVDGLAQGAAAARRAGIVLIPAVELSAVADGRDTHILAYFVDPQSPLLAAQLVRLRAARAIRAEAMVSALRAAGYQIELDDVLALSAGGAVGRSHVARALVAAGYADTVALAFQTLIGRDRPFYIAKQSASPADVVAGVRELGAIPVLAHPGVTGVDDLIDGMIEAGLLGIEAYHADHSADQVARYSALAAERGLLVTGGTDFHGPAAPNPDVGAVDVPEVAVRALIAAGERLGRS